MSFNAINAGMSLNNYCFPLTRRTTLSARPVAPTIPAGSYHRFPADQLIQAAFLTAGFHLPALHHLPGFPEPLELTAGSCIINLCCSQSSHSLKDFKERGVLWKFGIFF